MKCLQIFLIVTSQLLHVCDQGDLTLDPPLEKFRSLIDGLFDQLPYLLSESAQQIAGLDPACWRQHEELVKPARCASLSFTVCLVLRGSFSLPCAVCVTDNKNK